MSYRSRDMRGHTENCLMHRVTTTRTTVTTGRMSSSSNTAGFSLGLPRIILLASLICYSCSNPMNHLGISVVQALQGVQVSRRQMVRRAGAAIIGTTSASIAVPHLIAGDNSNVLEAQAAPPVAVMAEELGYFPVTTTKNDNGGEPTVVTIMVPKRIQRHSSDQAVRLAEFIMKNSNNNMAYYTAYWCPHCARQRELWGREAWAVLQNVECAPQGYQAQPTLCLARQIDGYPTLIVNNSNGKKEDKTVVSGERDLADLAKAVGFAGFDPTLEENVPPPLGSSKCAT